MPPIAGDPKLTLFGSANSEHLAYEQWNNRGLPKITNNQAGNIVLRCEDKGIFVDVENSTFAESLNCDCTIKTAQGYVCIGLLPKAQPITT